MPFGKHRGKRLADVPTSYLRWLLAECDLSAWLLAGVRQELWVRGEPELAPPPPRTRAEAPLAARAGATRR